MPNATKYVDNVNGSNAFTGNSEAQAYADIATAIAACSGGGNLIYVQAGSNYTLTTELAINYPGDATNGRNRIEGYTTTPGARDGRPTITSATNSVNLFNCTDGSKWEYAHLNCTHTAGTRSQAFTCNTNNASYVKWVDCKFDGFTRAIGGSGAAFLSCIIESCEIKNSVTANTGTIAISSPTVVNSWIHHNAGDGISQSYGGTVLINTIFNDNARYGFYDSTGAGSGFNFISINCTFAFNGSDGLRFESDVQAAPFIIINNIFYSNSGYGHNWTALSSSEAANLAIIIANNAYGSNTSGTYTNMRAGVNDKTLTVNPFKDSTNGDFSLNLNAGGGLLLRQTGFGTSLGTSIASDPDIGAIQISLTPAEVAAAVWARVGRTLS